MKAIEFLLNLFWVLLLSNTSHKASKLKSTSQYVSCIRVVVIFFCRTRKNNAMWLYQHTARCPKAIQLFLDANSDYWCLVPMTLADPTLQLNEASLPPPPPDEKDSNELPSVRIKAYVKYLTDLIPTPPEKYTFSDCQKYQQRYFFQKGKDQLLFTSPQTNADLYNANIVAVRKYLNIIIIISSSSLYFVSCFFLQFST